MTAARARYLNMSPPFVGCMNASTAPRQANAAVEYRERRLVPDVFQRFPTPGIAVICCIHERQRSRRRVGPATLQGLSECVLFEARVNVPRRRRIDFLQRRGNGHGRRRVHR